MTEVFTYLCGRIGPGHQMKRKSGANPELSRGGEALSEFSGEKLRATDNHIGKASVRRPDIQKMLLLTRGIRKAVKNIINYTPHCTPAICNKMRERGLSIDRVDNPDTDTPIE